MTPIPGALLALALVMALGFAAHRASLCTVKAVAETLTSGTGHMLASFAKAVLWSVAVTGALYLLGHESAASIPERAPHVLALAGGFAFGMGAAINGGCSLSTLQRLADGELTMLATLAGFCAGVLGWNVLDAHFALTSARTLPLPWPQLGAWAAPLVALAGLWAAWEASGLWRRRAPGRALQQRLAARVYPLSGAAVVLGVSGGMLSTFQGAWSYTNFLRAGVASGWGTDSPPTAFHAVLFMALLAGMLLSAWQRGSLGLRWEGGGPALRRLGGGFLMGAGGALIPGGNDTLVLVAIPALSPWALATYLALLAGVFATLLAMRLSGGALPRVECVSDRCVSP